MEILEGDPLLNSFYKDNHLKRAATRDPNSNRLVEADQGTWFHVKPKTENKQTKRSKEEKDIIL